MKRLPGFIKRPYEKLVEKARVITLPGFQGRPIFEVAEFFIQTMKNGAISTRAAAVAFNFFLAIFPAIIFLFTLIPYIPIPDFQNELLKILQSVMPGNAFSTIEQTITDIVKNPRFGLLSFGFIATLYFSTNGIVAIMRAFNASNTAKEKRSAFKKRIASLWLFLIFTGLITIAISLLIFSGHAFEYFYEIGLIKGGFTYYLLVISEWLIVLAIYFLAISFIFHFAPYKRRRYKFISAGGSLATGLSIVTSLLFSYYVNNFGTYNELYGSIGTVIVLMLWLQLNAQILLIGYELNISIHKANRKNALKIKS
ncbi:MAG: YihY/virulence factor BrkB family protein [Bacteroidales bacterium]|nr:YihY/virulence factor BrkB family protein [Bacteroidales bacterium]